MTKSECLVAINKVYGASVTATFRFWNAEIETIPHRTIVFTAPFVEANIDRDDGMSQGEFEEHLKLVPDGQWAPDHNGNLTMVLH